MSDFLMSLKDVSLAFGGPSVLNGVSLSVSKGLRAALTGRNGEGKSTLMKVMAGHLEPDSGEIVRAPGLRIAYVSQEVPADRPGDSAFNALSGGRRSSTSTAASCPAGNATTRPSSGARPTSLRTKRYTGRGSRGSSPRRRRGSGAASRRGRPATKGASPRS